MRILMIAAAAALALSPVAASAIPVKGKTAPAFSLPTTDPSGKRKVTLSALRGKPVYINFFASWCGPCNDEAPAIALLKERYKKAGLQVIGVDYLEEAGRGADFQKKHLNPYTVVAVDTSGVVSRNFGVIALPVHVFIGPDGKVRVFRPGEMSPAEIEAAIKTTLH